MAKYNRKFSTRWLIDFDWVRFDGEAMYCNVCQLAGRKNVFVKGSKDFQRSNLERHVYSRQYNKDKPPQKSDHQIALEILRLRNFDFTNPSLITKESQSLITEELESVITEEPQSPIEEPLVQPQCELCKSEKSEVKLKILFEVKDSDVLKLSMKTIILTEGNLICIECCEDLNKVGELLNKWKNNICIIAPIAFDTEWAGEMDATVLKDRSTKYSFKNENQDGLNDEPVEQCRNEKEIKNEIEMETEVETEVVTETKIQDFQERPHRKKLYTEFKWLSFEKNKAFCQTCMIAKFSGMSIKSEFVVGGCQFFDSEPLRQHDQGQLHKSACEYLQRCAKVDSIVTESSASETKSSKIKPIIRECAPNCKKSTCRKHRTVTCWFCLSVFDKENYDVFKKHMKEHKEDTSNTCKVCLKKLKDQRALAAHMRIHRNEGRHQCDQCQKIYRTPFLLEYHYRAVHEKKQSMYRHLCSMCPKKFVSPNLLKEHERLHTNEKPLSCSLCSMKFRTKASLRLHKVTHSGVKNYLCRYCSKPFGKYNNRSEHEKKVHLKIRYGCLKDCGKKFMRKRFMEEHLEHCEGKVE